MDDSSVKILVVGQNAAALDHLRRQLHERSYRCWVASSARECTELSAQHHFPLVLSTVLPGSETFPWDGATRAVFYCYPVRNDCWWLPVIRDGERCFGDRALRAREFAGLLDQFRRELDSAAPVACVERS
jgi:hypothetical protein